jgi:hypothetical protein
MSCSDIPVYPICVTTGATFRPIIFKFWDEVNNVKTPIDITQDDFVMKVVDKLGFTILTFDLTEGFTIQNLNELFMERDADDMDIKPGEYDYEILWTTSDGIVTPWLKGRFTVNKK